MSFTKNFIPKTLLWGACLAFSDVLSNTFAVNAQNLEGTVMSETDVTVAQRHPEIKNATPDSLPSCFIKTQNGTTLDLSSICGQKSPSNISKTALPYIDLQQDDNRDGIPDKLAEALNRVEAANDKDAAIKELVDRLPYSEQTRSLQQQAGDLNQQLLKATTESESEQIIAQLKSTQQRMMSDPNYAKTQDALVTMFAPKTAPFDSSPQAKSKALSGKSNTDPSLSPSKQLVASGWLEEGDILFLRATNWRSWWQYSYAMWYTHVGNYAGNNQVLDSSNGRGVTLYSLSTWNQRGHFVAYGRNTNQWQWWNKAPNASRNAVRNLQGRGYNWNLWDKWTQNNFYCSQLVWRIHSNIGVDLDSNDWRYRSYVASIWGNWSLPLTWAAVSPDEIAFSSNVRIYFSRWY